MLALAFGLNVQRTFLLSKQVYFRSLLNFKQNQTLLLLFQTHYRDP